MKYKIFLTESLEVLENEELIGEANTYNEACSVITEELLARGFRKEPYWRILAGANATFIDFGSWSNFVTIIPPVPMSVLTGAIEET